MAIQAEKLGQFGHVYTYSAHPVPAAVALRTLELMEERNIVEHVRSLAPLFAERVTRLGEYASVGHSRSIGLIGAIEFVAEPNTRIKLDPKLKTAARVMKMIQDAGVIVRALPIDGIAFCPPLIITADEINIMFDRIESVMPEVDKLVASLA
jgi:4-aminobutyrate--pyruvate transaminase